MAPYHPVTNGEAERFIYSNLQRATKASKHACISLAVSNCHSFYSCSYASTLNVTIGVTLAKTIIKVMNFELIKLQQMTKQQITVGYTQMKV